MAKEPDPFSNKVSDLSLRTQFSLSIEAKAFRNLFVREYMKHFNGAKALHTIEEISESAAKVKAKSLLMEPYVLQLINEVTLRMRPEDIVTRNQVMQAMWKEATSDENEGGTRVAALSHLAKWLGLGKADEANTAPLGVMLIPVSDPNQWGQAALEMQSELKRKVVDIQAEVVPGGAGA